MRAFRVHRRERNRPRTRWNRQHGRLGRVNAPALSSGVNKRCVHSSPLVVSWSSNGEKMQQQWRKEVTAAMDQALVETSRLAERQLQVQNQLARWLFHRGHSSRASCD